MMRLQLATWLEVDEYLKRSTGIVIPIGSHEQHGPNGLIGTDAICPETIANGMAEREELMVGPTQSLGMAQHHLAFPGSITLRPSTLIAVICDTVESLAGHGFTHIYFLNGHGGNIATVNAAFSEIYADASLAGMAANVHLKLVNWFQGRRVNELSKELFGGSEGSHATPSEVSLTYFAYPDAVKQVDMAPRIAPTGDFRDANDFRERFPDGRIGSDPSLASVEHGRRLFEAGVQDALESYRAFLKAA
jgi:creatinine amidohydrolase